MVWWMWLACARSTAVAPLESPAEAEAEPATLRFAPDGRVIVSGRALLHVSTGQVTPILGAELTPSAARQAWEDLGQLHWTETGGASHLLDLPRLLPGEDARRMVAWIDEDRLYVHEIDIRGAYAAQTEDIQAEACRVVDVRTGAISTPKACVRGDFVEIWRVQMRGGLVAVDSAGEGHPGLSVYAWDPATGASEVGFPALNLYPFGPVDASLRADGGVDLLTPCHLGEERPCQQPDGEDRTEEPWRHYRWRPQGAYELVREGLPAWVAADPTGDRYAWMVESQVCVGVPGSGPAACHPVPPGAPLGQ